MKRTALILALALVYVALSAQDIIAKRGGTLTPGFTLAMQY